MRVTNSSDITRKQFSLIEHLLKSARKTKRPQTYDLYDIFCAIRYVLKEGCTWRGLPHDFPKWNIVCYYYQIWSGTGPDGEASVFDVVLQEPGTSERVSCGREEKTSMVIVDFKSVKNVDTTGKRVMTREKISGIKLHLAVDTGGLPTR
jgi:transposase